MASFSASMMRRDAIPGDGGELRVEVIEQVGEADVPLVREVYGLDHDVPSRRDSILSSSEAPDDRPISLDEPVIRRSR